VKRSRILALLAIALAATVFHASTSSASLLIRGYQTGGDSRYDRFADSSDFVGDGLDFSGVGQDATGDPAHPDQHRWATMISPHFFVCARHYAASGTVTFYDSTSQTNGHSYAVLGGSAVYVEGQTLPTDLYIGIIGSAASETYYPILDPNCVTVGQSLLVYGKSDRVGTNTISAIEDSFDLQTQNTDGSLTTISRQKGFDFVYNEVGNPGDAALVSGDSGAPSFVKIGNQLVLVGTHSGSDYSLSAPFPYTSTDTCPSFYIDEINAAMAALAAQYGVGAGEHVTVVPEPSALVLLAIAAIGLVGCYCRRSKKVA
jgi:hypothetical protein